jgi:hypothetical protein
MQACPGAKLRAFVDAQLLITAQADAASTDLAYGATALDIAREGTFHLPGGVAAISVALARAIRRAGGQIAYGTAAAGFIVERRRVCGVRLADGEMLRAPAVIAAIPLLDVRQLLGSAAAAALETGGSQRCRSAGARSWSMPVFRRASCRMTAHYIINSSSIPRRRWARATRCFSRFRRPAKRSARGAAGER